MDKPKYRHPLVTVGFTLTVLLFALPAHVNLLFAASRILNVWKLMSVSAMMFAIAVVPLTLGIWLTAKFPQKWRRSKMVPVSWVILGLNVVLVVLSIRGMHQR